MAAHVKGQFEAMGLAVIVVLVSLGMIFLLYFSFDDGTDVADRYGNQQTAQNIINAMLDTSIEDCPLNYGDLVEDYIVWKRNPCGPSLERIQDARKEILNATLTERDIAYMFVLQHEDGDTQEVVDQATTCNPLQTQRDEPGRRTLSFYPSPQKATIILSICYE